LVHFRFLFSYLRTNKIGTTKQKTQMRVVIQRVSGASVRISGSLVSSIDQGLLVLAGIEEADTEADIFWLVKKIANLRIFDDSGGVMNRSVKDIDGSVLVVSQFTLHANTRKGNRPSYLRAAPPEYAIPLYEEFVSALESATGRKPQTGQFGATMEVSLVNDGPVTIIMDSKNKDL
jgi:D-aminoacyl-tRNA deacylase